MAVSNRNMKWISQVDMPSPLAGARQREAAKKASNSASSHMICDWSLLELKTRLSSFRPGILVKTNPTELRVGRTQKMEPSRNKRTQNFENEHQSAGDSLLNTPNSFKRPRTPSNSEAPALTLQSGSSDGSVGLGWTIDTTINTRGQSKAREWPRNTRSPAYPVAPSTDSSYLADDAVMNNTTGERSQERLQTKSLTAAETVLSLKNVMTTDVTRRCFGMCASVLVCGDIIHGEAVGRLLAEHKLWLQHPKHELTLFEPYFNPQWLSPPGQEFQHDVGVSKSDIKETVPFSEKERSRVLQVLDSATGPQEFLEPQCNDILTTELKPYQKKALAMMVEKELGLFMGDGAKFPTVWERLNDGDAGSSIIMSTQRPKPCLGGLLADDMGLGKTITMLALISGTLDANRFSTAQSRVTTLVVTPLSSECHTEEVDSGFSD
ncbi:Helicase C-terminal [Fusarium mundagurra]|uniref:Helicase C-terminal n=1 Tax=Fusarium mundagurra TaxID=1567541 RepID=A0A8H5YH87_9HYPO|nr:Helicase C-terminal [Fusarium mundagurra]